MAKKKKSQYKVTVLKWTEGQSWPKYFRKKRKNKLKHLFNIGHPAIKLQSIIKKLKESDVQMNIKHIQRSKNNDKQLQQ